MLKLYKQYLEVIDEYLAQCFRSQAPFIHCKQGCTHCCELGEYPFSRLEMEYLLAGFCKLSPLVQKTIKENIKKLLVEKQSAKSPFLHRCPFLINAGCSLYAHRGLVCRCHGLASFEEHNGEKVIKLPECSRMELNYSEVLENNTIDIEKFKTYGLDGPIAHSLKLPFFQKELLKGTTALEFGEIRPILDWFN